MSDDFVLETADKNVDIRKIVDAINNNEYIYQHEVIFPDGFFRLDKNREYLMNVKYFKEVRIPYIRHYGNNGFHLGLIGRILNIPIKKLAIEFGKSLEETDDESQKFSLMVSIHANPRREIIKNTYISLKRIAKEFNLLLYDAQIGEYVDVNDPAELPPYYITTNS